MQSFINFCEKRFVNKSSRNAHEKIHFGIRPHKCQFCEKAFPRPIEKKRHEATHASEKLYKCRICETSFTHPRYRANHEKFIQMRKGTRAMNATKVSERLHI